MSIRKEHGPDAYLMQHQQLEVTNGLQIQVNLKGDI